MLKNSTFLHLKCPHHILNIPFQWKEWLTDGQGTRVQIGAGRRHILEALDASPSGLQLREIAEQTTVNRSTAYRFVAHLENEGYLLRDEAGPTLSRPN